MAGTLLAGQRLTAALVGVPGWTAMTLLNSWTNSGGGYVTAQYRYWALLNSIEVIGTIAHGSTSGTSQIWAILPALPASSQTVCVPDVNSGGTVNSTQRLAATSAGSLEFRDLPASTTAADFHGWISLDA